MTTDVLVIGAGPAGAGAASLLSAWGHRVVVSDRPGSESGRLAESIPPSAGKAISAIGGLDAIASAGFLPWRGNTVWWAGEAARVEKFPPGVAGFQVVRHLFDRRLRDFAARCGADIREGRVREAHTGTAPYAIVETAGVAARIDARILIDASGRAGVIARQGLRVQDATPHTIAVTAVWRREGSWPVSDDTHTLVASYADGWAWSVPTAPGERHFSVMVDPSRTELARGAQSRDIYLAELAKVQPFALILEGARIVDGPWGADASVYSASRYAGDGFLLVGDAASAIDPLSSFGVKKALASAWLAAVVANTVLVNPPMADAALAFFSRRELAVFTSARRQASRFAADAAVRTAHPFWIARADAPGEDDAGLEPDAASLATDPAVQLAFADLRTRPSIQLASGLDVRVEPRPAVRGREIVMEEHLVSSEWPEGLRYLRDVDLVALVRLAPSHRDVWELYDAVRRSAPHVTLPNFLGALSVLVANGALRHSTG